jgi:chaperonin GroES
LKTLTGKVMIQRDPQESMTAGGLVIPEEWRKTKAFGTVLVSGTSDVSEGDRVLFSKFGGHEFNRNGHECVVVKQRDLIAVIPEGCNVQ